MLRGHSKPEYQKVGFMSYTHDPNLRKATYGRIEPMEYEGPRRRSLTFRILVVGFILAYIMWKAF